MPDLTENPEQPSSSNDDGAEGESPESAISSLWKQLLGIPRVGLDDNFFEIGGTSLLATMLLSRINQKLSQRFSRQLSIAAIFEYPTVRSLASHLQGEAVATGRAAGSPALADATVVESGGHSAAVAIIGMTGRFPGADSVEEFWTNLCQGVESITFFAGDQLESHDAAAEAAEGYIAARPILPGADKFDAEFFGIYPREAERMDPQHRLFLECSWEALERAGYDPAHVGDSVGVFAGCSMNTYLMQNLGTDRRFFEDFTETYQVGNYSTMLGNDKDFLATRVSYKLNLRGPSITVQSACSTSLVAICQACQSLLTDGCDMALAGAASITFPQRRGYLPQEGGLASLDGHCRPFDHRASGTIFGHGVAVVLLKRLDDAIRDGDQMLAVIRGFAVNNDGSSKVGYTAPSVEGQSRVITQAQKMAGFSADSITYVEAHGTGTPLGDPIEVAALNKAFAASTTATHYCSLGTAKANVGHLDVASGATGLIKTVLQIQHRTIPGLLHFEKPNPHLELADSPFLLHSETRPWDANGFPLRAGVSAFGVGGTNAHVVMEEPPEAPRSELRRRYQLLPFSAKTPTALAAHRRDLARYFAESSEQDFADAAYTLQVGRGQHRHRGFMVAEGAKEASEIMRQESGSTRDPQAPFENPGVVFCFPGQGVQAVDMGRQLYASEPVFRHYLEACDKKLQPALGRSLLAAMYPSHATSETAANLNQTVLAQPAIFAFEYALAHLWLSWGVQPSAMVGHSVGEYVAACLAGVFSLDDALLLISARCRLMQDLPPGGMLAVRANEQAVRERLCPELDLAAVNSPQLSVVSGPEPALERFAARLDAEKILNRRLATSHAFHSRMVDPALEPFAAAVRKVNFAAPSIPYVSTLTGEWMSAEAAAKPEYWTRQLRQTVRFADAIGKLIQTPERVLLEVGPAETLSQIMRQVLGQATGKNTREDRPVILSTIASAPGAARDELRNEDKAMATALGGLWAAGVTPDWQVFHTGYTRHRVLLPTYPFERKRYWVEPPRHLTAEVPVLVPEEQARGVASDAPQVTARELPIAPNFPVYEQMPIEDQTMSSTNTAPAPASMTAGPDMLSELKALITDLSGTELADAEPDASFLELGFDSLFLTQLTQGIQSKFRVKLTFRQVMESFPTLGSLATHLESVVAPGQRTPAPASPALARPAAAPLPAPTALNASAYSAPAVAAPASAAPVLGAHSGSIESLFASQMQAMTSLFNQQIEVLRGQSNAAAPAPATAAVANTSAASYPPSLATAAATTPAPSATVAVALPSAESAAGSATVPALGASQPSKPVFTPFKPLQRGASGGLTPAQDEYLHSFIREYNQRTAGSKDFTQIHRGVFADGRVVSGFNAQIKELIYPLVVERSAGAYLWDKDGNRYIDILNGYGAILYGHSPGFIVDAVRKQLDLGFPIGPQTELAGECAELVRELTGMERTTFCNTGSEAVMGAMRLARTVTGRNLIVLFSGDYHGSFDEVLVKSVGKGRSMPVAPGIPRESVANILVLDYGTPESLEIIRRRADELAAVLVEPVQSRHPELQPVEFLKEVRKITEQSGTALIFDEVVTGFRTHSGGMQAIYGIRADIATYGKVVAGGLPVGILSGSSTYMDALDGGQWQYGDDSFPQVGVTFYAGTFMRHPLALAAVKASLEHIRSAGPALQQDLAAKTGSLVSDLKSLFAEFGYPSAVESYSSWFYFGVPQEPRLARLLHFHLRELGIHIQEGFPCFLTTAHTDADLQFVRNAFRTGLERMRAGDALPPSQQQEDAVSLAGVELPASAPVEAVVPEALAAATLESPAAEKTKDANNIAPASEPGESGLPASKLPFTESAITQFPIPEFPITEQQREILFGTQLGDEANCAFNESTSLALNGPLDIEALIAGLEAIVERHDALRSTIDEDGETGHIAPSILLPLARYDLSHLSPDERDASHKALLLREASTPFHLRTGPLFRMRLIRLAPQQHVLVFTAHHIIFDGWSTNVVYGELSGLYNRLIKPAHSDEHRQGQPPLLAPPVPFRQYAVEQQRRLRTPEREAVEKYWLAQFKVAPGPLQLPTDRPRPSLRTNQGETKRFAFRPEVLQAVRKAGARQGSTLFATLLAAYSLLIHRLTQQEEVVIGIPVAGQAALDDGSLLVGHCVNFLPLRSHLRSGQPLAQFLKETRKTLLDAFEHQDYTYGTLLHKIEIARDPSRLQLVEVQFNVEQVGAGLKFDKLSVDVVANPKTNVNMDLFFNFVDRGSELWLDCDYNTGLFDAATIDRWFVHLETILTAFVADMNQAADEVSLLTAAQQEQILVSWNQTLTKYPRNESIHRIFEQQVKLTPHAVAVTGSDRSLTYAELNENANQMARFLYTSGVRPGSRVALCLERSPEVLVSLLATLKAGAVYVPIDPSYPASRLAFLIDDSKAHLLLSHRSIAGRLPALKTTVLTLEDEGPVIALEATGNLPQETRAEDAAYVMYTSGSTGNPKGVVVPHRAVLRLVKNNPFASFSADEVFLQLAPLSFDASTFEIWGALLNGGRLVLGPRDRFTPQDIGTLVSNHSVTTLWLTAALFHLIVTEHLEMLRPLRQLLAGGDVLSVTHVRRVCEQLPHLRLINGYGPTENTTFTCCHPISLESLSSGTVPIGRPIANTRIYILDAQKKPVPPGVAAELYAAGDGLAIGYLNAPELTAEKFIEHTFSNGLAERLYRTGDLARYRADATVEFLGRADTQVKIRGYRIELAEIEHALEASPLVRAAVVTVREDWVSANDAPGDKRLAAYVIAKERGDAPALVRELRKHLQEQLPEYMQPAAIVVLDHFPRTLNGKVDRRALPAPQAEQLMRERPIVPPGNPKEQALAEIWTRVLGVKEISVEDSIFELGGDSLLIFRISTLANQAGLPVTARHLFQYRTIAAICAQLEDNSGKEAASPVSTIQAVPRSRYRKPHTLLQ